MSYIEISHTHTHTHKHTHTDEVFMLNKWYPVYIVYQAVVYTTQHVDIAIYSVSVNMSTSDITACYPLILSWYRYPF